MSSVILLPPSEGKAPDGDGPPRGGPSQAFGDLEADRAAVRDAVRTAIAAGEARAGRLLGARGPYLARALAEWEELDDAPTLPAFARYRGVVWSALDPSSLGRPARRRMAARVLVPSGLWGLVAATDPIPAYRLKMGASVPSIGPLATFWRPRITPLIDRRADGGWIIDLLPQEHAAALDAAAIRESRLLRVELVEEGDDRTRRAAGHAGKHLKGLLARAILEAGASTPRAVAALEVPGLRSEGVTRAPRGATAVFTRLPEPPEAG